MFTYIVICMTYITHIIYKEGKSRVTAVCMGNYTIIDSNNTTIKSVFRILTTENLFLPHPVFLYRSYI